LTSGSNLIPPKWAGIEYVKSFSNLNMKSPPFIDYILIFLPLEGYRFSSH
jgi:hypothetical protein